MVWTTGNTAAGSTERGAQLQGLIRDSDERSSQEILYFLEITGISDVIQTKLSITPRVRLLEWEL